MEIRKDTRYVIVTKYGYIQDMVEDDFIESNGMLENVCFCNDIRRADFFTKRDTSLPKYARGVPYTASLAEWVHVIGGEFVELTIVQKSMESVARIQGVKTIETTNVKEYSYPTVLQEEAGFEVYLYENKDI